MTNSLITLERMIQRVNTCTEDVQHQIVEYLVLITCIVERSAICRSVYSFRDNIRMEVKPCKMKESRTGTQCYISVTENTETGTR